MNRIEALVILVGLQSALCLGQTSLKEINLAPGPYAVGFQHDLLHDSTRTYSRIFDWNNEEIVRPIPTSLWYPSQQTTTGLKPLDVINYMSILKEEEEWEHLPNEHILNWFYYPNTLENQDHMKEQTSAFPGLTVADGKFPCIIYAPSYQASSIENFALCELLASHGFVVISSPSRGAENRFFESGTVKDMETQARDIEFLMTKVLSLNYVDNERIGTMGFSFGGLSNVLAQMRNGNIKAVISLDGSIKYQFKILKKSPFFDIEKMDVPFIHMAQKKIPEKVLQEDNIDPSLNTDFEFYDSLNYSKAYQLQFHDLTHPHFSTLGVLFQKRDTRQDKSDKDIMASYKMMTQYTLQFAKAYLQDDANSMEFLDAEIDINHKISKIKKKNKLKSFSFQDFHELARDNQYQGLIELYDSIQQLHPSLHIPEWNLNNLGLQLIFNPSESKKGIKVFLLATHLYPNSANLYDSLGEGYLFLGEYDNAIEAFEQSLILDPENQNAQSRLQKLRKK